MALILALLLIPGNIPSQQLQQELVLHQPPPKGQRYKVISYMDIHTGEQVWRIGLVEKSTANSITDSIGIEGVAGGAGLLVLSLREIINLLIRRRENPA